MEREVIIRIIENLTHQGHLHGLSGAALGERIREVLGKVGLTDRRDSKIDTLSGGLKRRVELAKGLLHRPRLLLLDEPSTGVDPGVRIEFWSHLEDLRRTEGVTVLLTTHLLEEADNCDRLAILDRGKLVSEGTPSDLKSEIGGEIVDGFEEFDLFDFYLFEDFSGASGDAFGEVGDAFEVIGHAHGGDDFAEVAGYGVEAFDPVARHRSEMGEDFAKHPGRACAIFLYR